MTSVYRPIDVLEKQVELINWWTRSPYVHGFDEAFQPMMDQYSVLDHERTDLGHPKLSFFLADRLNKSETVYVRSNIISRLWDFTDVYETHERETMQRSDIPVEHGFAYLEHSVHIIDGTGKMCSIKGILWSTEPRGVIIVMLSDRRDPLDDVNLNSEREYPGKQAMVGLDMPPLHIQSYTWGRRITALTVDDFEISPAKLEQDTQERHDLHKKHAAENVRYQNRFNQFLISLWEFMQEQIPQRMPADRPMRRRLQKAHSPLSEVTIIQLRPYDQHHYNDPDHVPQTVIWNHRWTVREHKRRWIDKHGNYRETTVSAHVKGPEHLPLIEKDRVYHVKK